MCGIVGIIGRSGLALSDELVEQMVADLAHRGPDGRGVMRRGSIALGHRRLSILDPLGGRQPMINEDGEVWVTFNGEIYNFRDVARELTSRGHVFRTQCDTEVIIHAWEEWGRGCLERFRGMFAFGIVDWRRGSVFIARDHFGIKPLDWILTDQVFAFSSEIAPLKRVPGFRAELDLSAIDEYLWFQYIPAPRTAFAQIRKLAPGHFLMADLDGHVQEPKSYWDFSFNPIEGRTASEWIERVDEAIKDSVSAHLVSDVSFGAFLSGGVDSSLIVATMSQMLDKSVETFSIGSSDPEFDETVFTKAASELIGTHHRVETVNIDALDILPELVRHYGEPFADSSAIPTWHVSRLARRSVPMVLSGDGADEFFAGYWSHGNWMDGRGAQHGPHQVEDWISHIEYIDRGFRRQLWRPEYHNITPSLPEVFRLAWERSRNSSSLHQVQHMDVKTYLPSAILKKVDIASMMHGLEVRTPFVDIRLAEVAASIPSHYSMIRGSDNSWSRKALLKDVASRYFPRTFLDRPKMGFAIPLTKWFKPGTQLWSAIRDRIGGSSSPLTNYFDPKAISNLLESRHAANIWQLLFFDEWLRQNRVVTETAQSVAPVIVDVQRTQKTRPRIRIIADVPHWIFERHALTLQKNLADEFEIEVGYMGDAIDESRYDLIYPLEWNLVPPHQIQSPIKWITGVRSHISWNDKNPDEFGWVIREKFQQVHAVSERLCKELKSFREDILSLTHGIDLNLFQPQSKPFSNPKRIRIGWAGNRRSPAKGFEQFIAPLADIAGVELIFCGYSDHLMNLDEMRHFYESIDIYICSSSTEGNNNSILEAAAMGRAIVTTDVGTVSEYLVHEHSALIVPRSAEAFRSAVERLRDNPQFGISLGKAAQSAVEPFAWKKKFEEHRNFFRIALGIARGSISKNLLIVESETIKLPCESKKESSLITTTQTRENQQPSSGVLNIL
jgi:asparagine synthase (glutamine-hydrolysing)